MINFKQIIKNTLSYSSILFTNKSKMSLDKANTILESTCKDSNGTCIANNKLDIKYDVQIIVPCYNVEKYVEECLSSVFNQVSKYSILVTIINDGSKDNTLDVINSFLEVGGGQHNNIFYELIDQDNRGLSETRNVALEIIKGRYIFFLDSDDKLYDNNSIECLLDDAYKCDADIIQGSWIEFNEDTVNKHIIPKSGIVSKSNGVLSGFPWGKLYKYTVLEHFKFPERYWFEDTPISFLLYGLDYRLVGVKDIVYSYRINPNGITARSNGNIKSIDSFYITRKCLEEFKEFKLNYDQRAYEYLLRQIVMNYKRTKKLDKKVKEAIFVLSRDLLNQYFDGFHTNVGKYKALESSIRSNQFKKYDFLMYRY